MTPTSTVTTPAQPPLTTEQVTTGRRLDAVREILRALETATNGLEVLAHEANRMAPDADAFKRQATLVADALTVS